MRTFLCYLLTRLPAVLVAAAAAVGGVGVAVDDNDVVAAVVFAVAFGFFAVLKIKGVLSVQV